MLSAKERPREQLPEAKQTWDLAGGPCFSQAGETCSLHRVKPPIKSLLFPLWGNYGKTQMLNSILWVSWGEEWLLRNCWCRTDKAFPAPLPEVMSWGLFFPFTPIQPFLVPVLGGSEANKSSSANCCRLSGYQVMSTLAALHRYTWASFKQASLATSSSLLLGRID